MNEMQRRNHDWAFVDAPWPNNFMQDCRQFFASALSCPAGLDIYDDVFDTPSFFPLQRKRELEKMIRRARAINPRIVMEIGTDKGGGFYHWCKCFPTVDRAIGAEIRGVPYAGLFERHFPAIDFLWLEGSSRAASTVSKLRRALGADRIDVLFIDGDKLQTLKDFRAYRPFMDRNGLIFIHDIRDGGPGRAFAVIGNTYRTETIIDDSESTEAKKRECDGESANTPYEGWLRLWEGRSCGVGVVKVRRR